MTDLAAIVRGAGRLTRRAVATAAQRLDGRGSGAPVGSVSQELPSILPLVRGGKVGEQNDWNAGLAIRSNTGHVYSAISFTESQIRTATMDARLLAHVQGDDTPDEVGEHYILDTLRAPNSMETGPELNGRISAWLQLAGYAVLVKVRDSLGRVIALWPLIPDQMRFVAGTERPIDGVNFYPQGFAGKAIGFAREDCVIFRMPSLTGSLYGDPVMRAAVLEKSIGDKALQMREAWFENQARPDYVLAPMLPTGKDRDTTLRRFYANLMIHHQGIEKYGSPLVVPHGTEVTTLSFSAEALQLIEQLNLTRDNIFEIFGVSAIDALVDQYRDLIAFICRLAIEHPAGAAELAHHRAGQFELVDFTACVDVVHGIGVGGKKILMRARAAIIGRQRDMPGQPHLAPLGSKRQGIFSKFLAHNA